MSNHKSHYRDLKKKLKFLLYENECFQESLLTTQRLLLKTTRDTTFLLDRVLHYVRISAIVSESDDETDNSEYDVFNLNDYVRKADDASDIPVEVFKTSRFHNKKLKSVDIKGTTHSIITGTDRTLYLYLSDGHMTPEEVERHLESRQSIVELVPEKAPPTVPTEMFSNDLTIEKL